jgi:integrase
MGCIWKRGKIYWIKYRRAGQPHYESSHSRKHEVASDLLKSREGDIVKGLPITPKIGKLTFSEAIQDLVNDHKMNERDCSKLEGRIKNHLAPAFERRRMADITTSDLTAYAVKRHGEQASNATINRELALLRRAYNLAKRAGKLLHAPHVPMLQESAPRAGFFEREEIECVIRHLAQHHQAPVRFGYLTGWRLSEVLKLEWRNIDLKANEIRLDVGSTKNKDGRVIVMPQELRDLIDQQFTKHEDLRRAGTLCPWVFFRKNGLRIRSNRKASLNAVTGAALPGRHFHDLRRSAARNFVRLGIPERVAMKLLGHKTRSIFDRYNIVSSGDLVDAAHKQDAVTNTVTIAGDNPAKSGNAGPKR